jgi:glycerol-3-phosphate acyltransferase PlsY
MLVSLGIFFLVLALTRYVSLASCVAIVLLPPIAGFFHAPRATLAAAAIVAVIVILKHRENLERLARGEERKLGRR